MSEFADLANATLTFTRSLTTKIDPRTLNQIPDLTETYVTRAYFRKQEMAHGNERGGSSLMGDSSYGVPVNEYRAKVYTVGRLPAWCENPTNPEVECTIDHLGSGYFYHEGKIQVVFDEISQEGDTTPMFGRFSTQGSGSNGGYI